MYGTKWGQLSGVTSWASLVASPNFRSAQRIWFKKESKEEEETEKKEGEGEKGEEEEGGRRRREWKGDKRKNIRLVGSVCHPRWPVHYDIGPLQTHLNYSGKQTWGRDSYGGSVDTSVDQKKKGFPPDYLFPSLPCED